MFDVIIPLRSGSKGIKNKNLKKFYGESLVNYTIKKLIKIKEIRNIFVLTDSELYKKKILKNKKIRLDYPRPKKLSEDNSSINHVVIDFLKWSKKKYDIKKILFFHVTCPLISVSEIKKTIKFIKKSKINSLIHVSEVMEHPYECIDKIGKNWKFVKENLVANRQNYEKFFFITGSMYYFTKEFILKNKRMYNKSSYAYEVDKINFVDINTKLDFEIAKALKKFKIRN